MIEEEAGAGPARPASLAGRGALAVRAAAADTAAARPGRRAPGVSVWSEALGAELCAAVAAGRSLEAVCAEPGRPHRTTVRRWERTHPEFGQALRAAYREARVSSRMRDRQRAAELATRPPPQRGGKASAYTQALGEVICARLANGRSLTSIGRDADMPCYGTIFAWLKRHPEFEEMYVAAREVQAEYLFDEARDVALGATKETVPVARLQFDVIRWQAARLAPKKYLDRLVAAEEMAELGLGPRGGMLRAGGREAGEPIKQVVFSVTRFERGPAGRVLCAPPRNAEEARAWLEDTGAPYTPGIGPNGEMRPPPLASLAGG